jgi:hypothetical protein
VARTQQDADLRRWILAELRRLFKTLKPWLETPPETEQGYAMALDHVVSEFEMTALVNEAIRTRWSNLGWPSPAELRDLLAEMRERLGTPSRHESADDCEKCRGTGFEIVEQDGARKARPCTCRRRAQQSSR